MVCRAAQEVLRNDIFILTVIIECSLTSGSELGWFVFYCASNISTCRQPSVFSHHLVSFDFL